MRLSHERPGGAGDPIQLGALTASSPGREPGSKEEAVSEQNKAVVRRLVDEVMNAGDLDVLDTIYTPRMAAAARAWIAPFRASFPDVHMRIVTLIAEGDTVVGRFLCSGTQHGQWQGHPPTGRRFERVAEVYFFELRDGRIASAWGLEDNLSRMIQLGYLENPADE